MKRSPLQRKTPLRAKAASAFSGQRTSLRRAPLRARSAKRQAFYEEERIPLVKALLAERPWCEACPLFAELDGKTVYVRRPSRDIHEVLSRARAGSTNANLVDVAGLRAVCGPCHDRITCDKGNEATKLGLLRHIWDSTIT